MTNAVRELWKFRVAANDVKLAVELAGQLIFKFDEDICGYENLDSCNLAIDS